MQTSSRGNPQKEENDASILYRQRKRALGARYQRLCKVFE
jgi:hypothetical protein